MTIRTQREQASGAWQPQSWLPEIASRLRPNELGTLEPKGGDGLLPETRDLLARLQGASCAEDLEGIAADASGRVAAYRAVAETNLPYLRFRIHSADPAILAFVGKAVPGFEVLEVFRAGFQFHWRRDLVRSCDEQLPFLGHLCGLSASRELALDHVAVPIIRKARVREVQGWLIFGDDHPEDDGAGLLYDIFMFRRSSASRSLRLPATVSRPRAEATRLQEMLRSLRRPRGRRARQDRPG